MHDGDYFEVGQSIYVWVEVRDRLKALLDPQDLELHIKPPTGALIVRALGDLEHMSTGLFSDTFVVTEPGIWKYAFHSTGPDDVDGDRFHVSNSSQP